MTDPSSIEKATGLIFERTPIHDGQSLTASEAARIEATLALVPDDAASLIEVGCGSGQILSRVATPLAFGTDLVRRGMKLVQRPTVQASIYDLPFASRGVDAVLCAETLEHLPRESLPQAAAELCRIAQRYVIITVPNEEDLLFSSHRCSMCGTVFHINGHLSSLGEADIKALFPRVARFVVRRCWPVRPYSRALLELRTGVFDLWKYTRHTVCPSCRSEKIENHEKRFLYRACGALNTLLHPRRSDFNWLLVRAELE